ncbi:bifunctional tryptophan synthase TRP1 [Pisolithus microcarpus]|nr:bifunctional tryptophan synthase TRP1 [Pisolithus microcarpus]
MDAINAVFDTKKPRKYETFPILLAMLAGETDIIEGGVPVSDPFADGPAIQATTVQVREARSKGLTVPVLSMGYYNSILAYGEDQAVQDAREADSFYIVSRMGTTEPSVKGPCSASGGERLEGSSSSDSSTAGVQSSQCHYLVVAGIPPQTGMKHLPPQFCQFGSQYIPEAPFDYFIELEEAHNATHYGYMSCPSKLYLAESLTSNTGSHKINNAVGQILLAKCLGKTRIIAKTSAGQHGMATATVCARFGTECVIYMSAKDAWRQALNVFHMKMLGAKVHTTWQVVPVESGSKILKDAGNEAMRDWVTNLATTHFLIMSRFSLRSFLTIMKEATGKHLDAVVTCIGGSSNAIGTFISDTSVHLVSTASITALLWLEASKDSGRMEYVVATDEEALRGFRLCTQLEGIIPALEFPHALWEGLR